MSQCTIALHTKRCILVLLLVLAVPCSESSWLKKNNTRTVVIGGIPLTSESEFLARWRPTFEDHLRATVGRRFQPPVDFKLVPVSQRSAFDFAASKELDFFFTNPSLASCLEAEFNLEAVATLRNIVLGEESSQFAGVIFARADNDDVNFMTDLKGKILEASSLVIPGSGLLQWQEMRNHNLDMFADSAQIRFVGDDQSQIVFDVLNRSVDVGFVRSGYIEKMVADNHTRWDDFKVISMKPPDTRSYSLTQVVSTAFVPEWPLMAAPTVDSDLRAAISSALRSITSKSKAARLGQYSTWDLPLSYSRVALSLWDVGVLRSGEDGSRVCIRPGSGLYDAITCPAGHFKRSRAELSGRCADLELSCPDGVECVCNPCKQADEVAISIQTGNISHLCQKMQVCAVASQLQPALISGQDNLHRTFDLQISLTLHATESVHAAAKWAEQDGRYTSEIATAQKGKHLLTVRSEGHELPNSPFFIEIVDRDCAPEFGADSFRVADDDGVCVCGSGTFEVNAYCIPVGILVRTVITQLFFGVLLLLGSYKLLHGRQLADDLRQISIRREDLTFGDRVQVLGKGQHGVVCKGKFKGCDVAVKCLGHDMHWMRGRAGDSFDFSITSEPHGSCSTYFQQNLGGKPLSKTNSCDSEVEPSGAHHDLASPTSAPRAWDGEQVQPEGQLDSRTSPPLTPHIAHSVPPTPTMSLASPPASPAPTGMRRRRASIDDLHPSRLVRRLSLENTVGLASLAALWQSTSSSIPPMTPQRVEQFQEEMRNLLGLRHPCIATLMGVVTDEWGPPLIVMELMEHGSLRGLLSNKSIALDTDMVAPMVRDVIQGMSFLHASRPPVVHGDLKSDNILVDRNFRAKVADFGLSNPKSKSASGPHGTPPWMAPELLALSHVKPNAKSDVYAFGILVWEMASRQLPYREELETGLHHTAILDQVRRGVLRPRVPHGGSAWMVRMMEACWAQQPEDRPTFEDLDLEVQNTDIGGFHAAAMSSLERFKATLDKSDAVLRDVFPPHVVRQLLEGKQVEPERKEEVTIFFSDIVGYTDISSKLQPTEVSDMLHRLYQQLDALAHKHGVFKMGIIGDAWMGVTNIEEDLPDTHASVMAHFALDAIEAARSTPVLEGDPSMGFVQIRGGFHSGPVVADVVGTTNLQYCLFGDTVNTASRMESTAEAMRIQCSATAARLVHHDDKSIPLELRGRISVKGKGSMKTYWVGGDGKSSGWQDTFRLSHPAIANAEKAEVIELATPQLVLSNAGT